jgi:hypothetical protein
MVVQTECIQRYEPSLSRSYIPVRTLTSSLRLDIRNSAEKKGPRLSCQVAHMIILAVEYLSFEHGSTIAWDVECRNVCQETRVQIFITQSQACDYRDISIAGLLHGQTTWFLSFGSVLQPSQSPMSSIVLGVCRIFALCLVLAAALPLSPSLCVALRLKD